MSTSGSLSTASQVYCIKILRQHGDISNRVVPKAIFEQGLSNKISGNDLPQIGLTQANSNTFQKSWNLQPRDVPDLPTTPTSWW